VFFAINATLHDMTSSRTGKTVPEMCLTIFKLPEGEIKHYGSPTGAKRVRVCRCDTIGGLLRICENGNEIQRVAQRELTWPH